jgi:hypothetical protein
MKPVPQKTIRKKRALTRKAVFLLAIADHRSIASSARLAGIDRSTHYDWMARDEKYKAAFYLAVQMAKDAVFEDLVQRGTVGVFKPFVYKGEFCYEKQQRVLCELADGTTAFEDELPQGAEVIQHRMVTTRGKQLGYYKLDGRALWKAMTEMPEDYGGLGWPGQVSPAPAVSALVAEFKLLVANRRDR